eukprot:6483188-Amphidinium_carterae.2
MQRSQEHPSWCSDFCQVYILLLFCQFNCHWSAFILAKFATLLHLSGVGLASSFYVQPRWIVGAHPASSRRKRSCQLYDPGLAFADHCFYASLCFAMLHHRPRPHQVRRLRHIMAMIWEASPSKLEEVAMEAQLSPADYLLGTRSCFWGGLPDLTLLTSTLGLNAQFLSPQGTRQIGYAGGPMFRFENEHYVVCHAAQISSWRRLSFLLRPGSSNLLRHFLSKFGVSLDDLKTLEELNARDSPSPDTVDSTHQHAARRPQRPSASAFRGGMVGEQDEIDIDVLLQLPEDDDADEPTETHILSMLAICTYPYPTFQQALRRLCAIFTSVMGFTIGYYHQQLDETLDFVISDEPRTRHIVSTYELGSAQESWITFDAISRMARRLGCRAILISLITFDEVPDNWAWPVACQGFNTRWMRSRQYHAVVIDHNAHGLMVLSSTGTQPALWDHHFRGGNPDIPPPRFNDDIHRPQGHPLVQNLEEIEQIVQPPRVQLPFFALFVAHVLRPDNWLLEYAATLHRTAWVLSILVRFAVHFDFFMDDMIFLADYNIPYDVYEVAHSTILPLHQNVGVAFEDLILRAAHEGHVLVFAVLLPAHPPVDHLADLIRLETLRYAQSPTAWALHVQSTFVLVFDFARQTLYIVARPSTPMIDGPHLRGGSATSSEDSSSMSLYLEQLPPRIRMRRIQLYNASSFGLPEVFYVPSTLCQNMEEYILSHIGAHLEWTTLTVRDWSWTYRLAFPRTLWAQRHHWAQVLVDMISTANSLFLGYRATRQYGLLVRTEQHAEALRSLNAWAATWTPGDFVWNAIAIVKHVQVATHRDSHNLRRSIAYSFANHAVWLEYQSKLNDAQARAPINQRPVLFDPTSDHAVWTQAPTITLVLYHTARQPRWYHIPSLIDLGFRPQQPYDIPPAQLSDHSSLSAGSPSGPPADANSCLGDSSSQGSPPCQTQVYPQSSTLQPGDDAIDSDTIPLSQLSHTLLTQSARAPRRENADCLGTATSRRMRPTSEERCFHKPNLPYPCVHRT